MKLLVLLMLTLSSAFAQQEIIVLTSENTLVMNNQFDEESVAKVQAKALDLSFKSSQDLYLILNTPGGSVGAGKELIQFLKALPNKVHTITLYAASMGYNTAQGLGTRYILPSGILMSHRASIGGLKGQIPGEVESRVAFLKEYIADLEIVAAGRAGISVAKYNELILNEYWVTGENAVKAGHADKMVLAKCDVSLSGEYTETYRTFFGNFDVVFSSCPLISGPLDVKVAKGANKQKVYEFLNFRNTYRFEF